MKKIKVLQLAESLEIGGMERVVASIARGLDPEAYEVSVWSIARGGQIASELEKEGKQVKVLGIDNYYNPLNVFKLSNLIKKERPDIIHTHGYFASTIGRIAAKLAKVPIIVTHVHSTYWGYTKRNILIERELSKFTDRIICCSDAVKRFVVEHENISDKKAVTIYNGVEIKEVNDSFKSREALGIRENDIMITTVGSLTPHKGQRYLIEAVAHSMKTHDNIRCFIVGDGPLRVEFENYAISLGIGAHINFLGRVGDISEVINATDIFVMPSSGREGLGIAVLEAMAYGKPVIASDIGGLPEVVIDSATGYLVKPKDVHSIASVINKLVEDGSARIAMGSEGKRVFEERFKAKFMISRIDDLYKELLETKKILPGE